MPYIGRFAPSPTGPLHAGSLVAALASYLDARAHGGTWLLRIEDIDEARTVTGAAEDIIATLAAFGMRSDGEIVWQSRRKALYESAFAALGDRVYPCACSRKEIADSRVALAADGAAIYPGTCRAGLVAGRPPRAWRLRVPERDDPAAQIIFNDRWQGTVSENLAEAVGDFVLRRADGFWAYQIAVVVDDALQQVTDVVRGADLLESTARQIYLQRLLGVPTPRYLHVPVVANERGEKLSKQTGATALDRHDPVGELYRAAERLGLTLPAGIASTDRFWAAAVPAWAKRVGVGIGAG
jgi:glutamyl-Q tRNA(Asp) synthetase